MPPENQQLAILFADIGESTRLYERLGDVEAHRQISLSLKLMEAAIVGCSGQLLRTVGDAALASFETCDDAFYAARAIQESHQNEMLSVRVGFHFGEVIPDKGDVYGAAVNAAARVASFARLEEITLSGDACAYLSQANRAHTTLIDAITLKGIDAPMNIHRIDWQTDRAANTVVASAADRANADYSKPVAELIHADRTMRLDESAPVIEIGRDAANHLSLTADCVSRHHLQLHCRDRQILLVDNSTNGSFIHRDQHNPIFVRRESVVLEGSGQLGVGAAPSNDNAHTLHYLVRYE